jgi:hypothetical protein
LRVARKHRDVWVQITSTDHTTEIRVLRAGHLSYLVARRIRRSLVSASSLRAGPQSVEADLNPDLVAVLGVYAGQFASYTTLLWQVPVLGLTAQAFLLTIALGGTTSSGARIMASGISIVVVAASEFLMHDQRGRAINHGELLRRVSEKLALRDRLGGSVEVEDAWPKRTNAENVWGVDHLIYHAWRWCLYLFGVADLAIIVSTACNRSWFK